MDLIKAIAKLPCTCGRVVEASTTEAGTRKVCRCGSDILIPNLSELRRLAGKHAYVTNPAELITDSLSKGINPSGDSCLCCKSSNPVRFTCIAECESFVVKGGKSDPNSIPRLLTLLGSFTFLPKLLLLFAGDNRDSFDEPTILGHDVTIEFPLMVCNRCARTGNDPRRPSVAKNLMKKVPMYKDLLAYYPDLRLSFR